MSQIKIDKIYTIIIRLIKYITKNKPIGYLDIDKSIISLKYIYFA